jgi:hypothetical protein
MENASIENCVEKKMPLGWAKLCNHWKFIWIIINMLQNSIFYEPDYIP